MASEGVGEREIGSEIGESSYAVLAILATVESAWRKWRQKCVDRIVIYKKKRWPLLRIHLETGYDVSFIQKALKNPDEAREFFPLKAMEIPDPRPLPAEPTNAIPGSREKMKVYQERIKANTQLFHPQDLSWIDTGEEFDELSSYKRQKT